MAKDKGFDQIEGMKATVLGIGTELTTGQIVNKNASWISAQLKRRGVTTALHLVVPDERDLILAALNECSKFSDLIFVTGGLGPTSDDFTRDVITEWTERKTFFHEPSWEHVNSRLTARGFTVREFQKQQCFYPEGSTVITNPQGTANGFYLQDRNKDLFILPGPPREIEAIWNSFIQEWLVKKTINLDPLITKSWDTIGVGESEIAYIAEKILANQKIEKGYRVHLPYVEFKLTYLASQQDQFEDLVSKIDRALQPYTLVRNSEDLAQTVSEKILTVKQFALHDEVTGAHLISRLNPFLRGMSGKVEFSFSNKLQPDRKSLFDLLPNSLSLQMAPNNQMQLNLKWNGSTVAEKLLPSPFASELMAERRPQYFAEIALAEMAKI
ncbi:MAG: competence/damage-inducible protein A [Pseudobdellovibrionaceae bacterium]